ncbi:MAG: hypothetical protein AABX33_05830 [Nanoarchaeota archaeon]
MKYFFDTYALIEIVSQNPKYRNYSTIPIEAGTTIFNLVELHFYYLKNFGSEEAERIYNLVSPLLISTDDDIIKDANKFKVANLKERFSFTDCIGYIASIKLELKFVTGDYAFKGLENVEFVR